MPACRQAVGCGVCDTPELWRGAAGLYARVRACAGAAESLRTYINTTSRSNEVQRVHIQRGHEHIRRRNGSEGGVERASEGQEVRCPPVLNAVTIQI